LPGTQVDVLQAQGEQLAAAQPGRERQNEEGFEPLALDDAEQPFGLLNGHVGTAVPDQRRCLHLGGDVRRHEFQPVGVGQGVADQLVDVLDRGRTGRGPREVCVARVSATSRCT
jgi:hypothetical protein